MNILIVDLNAPLPDEMRYRYCSAQCAHTIYHERCCVDWMDKHNQTHWQYQCLNCHATVSATRNTKPFRWINWSAIWWWIKFIIVWSFLLGYVYKTYLYADGTATAYIAGPVTLKSGQKVDAWLLLPWPWDYRFLCNACPRGQTTCEMNKSPLTKYFRYSRGFWPDGCHMLLGSQLLAVPLILYAIKKVLELVWKYLPFHKWTREVSFAGGVAATASR
jgi:hypothetical protein